MQLHPLEALKVLKAVYPSGCDNLQTLTDDAMPSARRIANELFIYLVSSSGTHLTASVDKEFCRVFENKIHNPSIHTTNPIKRY